LYYKPRFINIALVHDQHLSVANKEECCTYFETVPGATVGGYTQTAGLATWTGPSNPLQAGTNTLVFICDLVVENGGRLILNNMNLKFANGSKVVVKQGGYLETNSCLLTSINCPNARWPGVEVNGNTFSDQVGSGVYQVPQFQGKLKATNTTIENAQIGVLAARRSGQAGFVTFPTSGGGIVLMTSCTVRNCDRGVDFRRYPQYIAPGDPLPQNRSRFSRSSFLLNSTDGSFTFQSHARLENVSGIVFAQCNFENQNPASFYALSGSAAMGYGIESYQSEFKVLPRCNTILQFGQECPNANTLRSKFVGLDHGIHALGGPNALRNFTVDRTEFTDNICGVYTSGVIGFVAKRNIITLGGRNVPLTNPLEIAWNDHHRGIYSFNGYGFIVEDNVLDQSGDKPTEGIVIGYSKDNNDMVFRNQANNLERAYIGEGQCVDLDQRAVVGLHFQCNTNNDNNTNFWSRIVTTVVQDEDDETIRTQQGTPQRVADNTFDQEESRLDFRNDGCENNLIGYWWALPETLYKPIYTICVVEDNDLNGVLLTRNSATCNSRLRPRPGVLVPSGMELTGIVQEEKLAYGEVAYLYTQLLDGGNRDEVVDEITSAWPNEAWQLLAYLLDRSPYLSTEVLKEVFDKPGFPMAMKAQVCIANPDATKEQGFIKWLQYDALEPMPASLIGAIEASWETKTFRTQLQGTMADHHSEMTQAAMLLLERLGTDSITEPTDSLRGVWRTVRTAGARYAEALSLMQQGAFAQAHAVVTAIPEEHQLKVKEESERWRMLELISFMAGIALDNRTDAELTQGEQAQLTSLIADQYDRSATWAQNLLCFHYGNCKPPMTGGDGRPKSAVRGRQPLLAQDQPLLAVMPNPATTWATFTVTLTTEPNNAFVVVRDQQGRLMTQLPVNNASMQLVWDTREVAPGMYTVELVNRGSRMHTEKLIVKP